MNIVMNNKYYKMHTEVLDVCENNGIRMIPGMRAAYEILTGKEVSGNKEFLLTPEDMDVFYSACEEELKNRGYIVVRGKFRNYQLCRIFREDMTASSVAALMSNPEGRHCPQFIIRKLEMTEDVCSYTSNGKVLSFGAGELETLEKTEYKGSVVYAGKDLNRHFKEICAVENPEELTLYGYALFSTECPASDFINEAVKRGYLSKERISRYDEFTAWKKENRSENEKKYREYQEVLLGLKQP